MADITLPDDEDMLNLQLSGDDSMGLFDDDNASSSLALAVQEHNSFMQIDDISLLGSQVSLDEEHFVVRKLCSRMF